MYSITSISFDEENSRILLGTKETSWLKSYRTKKIEFGQTPDRHYLHQHNRLSRRQAKPTSTSTALHVVSAAVSLVPTATPTEESVTFDLSNDQNETTFSLPGGISVGPPLPITVGCKRCTTKGQLILTQGEIDFVDLDDIRPQNFRDFDFIESGFFQLQLNGFESSILLRAIPSVSASLAYDLYTLPVRGFKVSRFAPVQPLNQATCSTIPQIKGIGAAGLLFQPQIAFDISVKGGVELTWGFKVNVCSFPFLFHRPSNPFRFQTSPRSASTSEISTKVVSLALTRPLSLLCPSTSTPRTLNSVSERDYAPSSPLE